MSFRKYIKTEQINEADTPRLLGVLPKTYFSYPVGKQKDEMVFHIEEQTDNGIVNIAIGDVRRARPSFPIYPKGYPNKVEAPVSVEDVNSLISDMKNALDHLAVELIKGIKKRDKK